MLVKALRNGLGNLIIFIDFITRPRKMPRPAELQAEVDQATQKMALYQFRACPFCVKTRRMLHRLNLNVAVRDAKNDPQARQELEQQGGKIQVPCLRIEENDRVTWLYESAAINTYLEERFG